MSIDLLERVEDGEKWSEIWDIRIGNAHWKEHVNSDGYWAIAWDDEPFVEVPTDEAVG